MTRVLLIGADPDAVDYTDPALPNGLDAETIKAGIEAAMDGFHRRGWEADHCLIQPADQAGTIGNVRAKLTTGVYDCVVVGAGIRLPPTSLILFEAILNAVHAGAPQAAIAFNTVPEDSAVAAARWIGPGQPAIS